MKTQLSKDLDRLLKERYDTYKYLTHKYPDAYFCDTKTVAQFVLSSMRLLGYRPEDVLDEALSRQHSSSPAYSEDSFRSLALFVGGIVVCTISIAAWSLIHVAVPAENESLKW